MDEECVICGTLNTLAEIITIKKLKIKESITYLSRMVYCSECGTYSASGIHMHLNKIEMLMAQEKQKALSKQSQLID
jgi:uncharacterized Zn finger protein